MSNQQCYTYVTPGSRNKPLCCTYVTRDSERVKNIIFDNSNRTIFKLK